MTNDKQDVLAMAVSHRPRCYLHKTRLASVFCGLILLTLLPNLAQAVVGCSSYKQQVVINEFNTNDKFIELKILNSTVAAATNNFAGWKLTTYKGSGSSNSVTATVSDGYKSASSCGTSNDTYMKFTFSASDITTTSNTVLTDASGNEVDYLRISASSSYPAFYNPACTSFSYPTDGPTSIPADRKAILRFPDGTGAWKIGEGSGNNGEESMCTSNSKLSLLLVTKSPSVATVVMGSNTLNTFTWTFTVKNDSNTDTLSNVVITDALPAYMYLTTCPSNATCTGSAGAYTGFTTNSQSYSMGQTVTFSATAYVTWPNTVYTNTAYVTATDNLGSRTANGSGVVTSTSTIHHVRLDHTGAGLTCTPAVVTVNVCNTADSNGSCAANTLGLTGNVIVRSASNAILATLPFSIAAGNSSTSVNAWITTAQTVTFEATGLSLPAQTSWTCWNGSTASCSYVYSDSGFLFDVPNHVSETLQTVNVSAVKKSDNSLACIPAFANVSKSVTFKCSYSNPVSGTFPVRVNGSALNAANNSSAACDASGRAVSLSFNASGIASTTFQYADVGNMALTAAYTGSGSDAGLIMTGSDSFIAKPDHFSVSAIKQTAAPQLLNPAAASATDAKFIKAGEAFTATVTALNAANNATPNFGKETTAEGVKLTQNLILPSGGVSGTLSNATLAGASFSNGSATVTNLAWDEVGIITLTPGIADADYLGAGNVSGTTTGNIGRFIPDHFALTSGTVTPFCAAGNFTYFGQDGFSTSFTLTAQNLANATTQNYTGSFAKLGLTSWSNFGFTAVTLPTGATLSASATAPTGNWTNGVATVSAKHQISRPTALAGETGITIKANPVDSDGVALATATAVAGSTPLRYGRLFLQNVYGSELLNLVMPLTAQYWNGSNWITNSNDSCTTSVTLSLTDPNTTDGLTTSKLCAWDTGSPGNSGLGCAVAGSGSLQFKKPPLNGDFNLNFKAPGTGNTGALDVTATVSSYLQFNWRGTGNANPTDRATFGVYKGNNKQIYFRELY